MMQQPLNAMKEWWTDERLPITHQHQKPHMLAHMQVQASKVLDSAKHWLDAAKSMASSAAASSFTAVDNVMERVFGNADAVETHNAPLRQDV